MAQREEKQKDTQTLARRIGDPALPWEIQSADLTSLISAFHSDSFSFSPLHFEQGMECRKIGNIGLDDVPVGNRHP